MWGRGSVRGESRGDRFRQGRGRATQKAAVRLPGSATSGGQTVTPRSARSWVLATRAAYSPQRIENNIGTLLLAVAGLADTARVIVVMCERVGKVNSYAILAARPATPEEIKLWMEGTR
jgi:hypothetical protein